MDPSQDRNRVAVKRVFGSPLLRRIAQGAEWLPVLNVRRGISIAQTTNSCLTQIGCKRVRPPPPMFLKFTWEDLVPVIFLPPYFLNQGFWYQGNWSEEYERIENTCQGSQKLSLGCRIGFWMYPFYNSTRVQVLAPRERRPGLGPRGSPGSYLTCRESSVGKSCF